ncbi:hypothetical protein RUND412_003057 [Rhizina undulata]
MASIQRGQNEVMAPAPIQDVDEQLSSHLEDEMPPSVEEDKAESPTSPTSTTPEHLHADTIGRGGETSALTGLNETFVADVTARHPSYLEDTAQLSPSLSPMPSSGSHRIPALSTAPVPLVSPAKRRRLHPILFTHAWLTLFSVMGTLARLGLTGLTTYPGAPIGGLIWAQFAGCLVMGFLIEDLRLFGGAFPTKKYQGADGRQTSAVKLEKTSLPLYIGLATGFCGSVTSFSSFLLIAFNDFSNNAPAYPDRPTKGYNFLAFLAYIIATLSLSYSGLQFGAHLAVFLRPVIPLIPHRMGRAMDWCAIPLSLGVWIGSIIMAILIPRWRGKALFACVFSPLGVYARFWISRKLNPVNRNFPLGTFTVNILGTLILAGMIIGRSSLRTGTGCQVMRGVGDGLCGCLTTISTFIVEIRGLKAKHAYIYGGVSIVAGMCVMFLVLGSYTWTQGVDESVC